MLEGHTDGSRMSVSRRPLPTVPISRCTLTVAFEVSSLAWEPWRLSTIRQVLNTEVRAAPPPSAHARNDGRTR
jgi:hypothetical protein